MCNLFACAMLKCLCNALMCTHSISYRYDLPDQCRLKMTENDIKTGKELLQEAFIMKNPKWMKELERMVRMHRVSLFLLLLC